MSEAVFHPSPYYAPTAEGYQLEPLPFTGDFVINHGDSTSRVSGGLGSAGPENAAARYTLKSRLSHLKRIGLSLPSLAPLPDAARSIIAMPYKSRGFLLARL